MIFRKLAAATIPAVAAVIVGTGTAAAEPTTPDVGYRAELVGNTVITTLVNGTFELTPDGVEIRDKSGAALIAMPLSVRDGTFEYPLPHAVRADKSVLEITAVKDVAKAVPNATPVASPAENLSAQSNFSSTFGLATAVGGFIGTGIGAVIGFTVGLLFGGIGAIPGLITGASVGGIIGTLVAGGPTLVIAGLDLINTYNAPPGTTKWAPKTN
ncbi:ammonium transporter [Nocardia camponoti]|uniref:DUF8020 domain-containing protein n=1 Tax=Nocardia camponoti TaxID=1616106 RepID=A0A917VB93_9NOCA|nr:ammonium transporter [Nocardia camponoti]GGK58294.1 hypothetical protein GCM10011591_33130 [Nocardia camponoti]